MKIRSLHTAFAAIFILLIFSIQRVPAYSIKDAKHDITRLRYDEAREKLVGIAVTARGEKKQQALLLLANLKRSPDEAEILYQEIIEIDPQSSQAYEANLELAKIRYASGKYHEALLLLQNSAACQSSREACYFEGLSALMAKDFMTARDAFTRIHRGKYRMWAALALAELDLSENNPRMACSRYESLSNAMINPIAMYRFAECQERSGDIEAAEETFQEIVESFKDTPEALLASEKLKVLGGNKDDDFKAGERTADEAMPRQAGFTIQFGSFHDRRNAIKLAEEIKKNLPGARIDTDLVNYREVHRVRYGYFPTREEAQLMADRIRARMGNDLTIMKIP